MSDPLAQYDPNNILNVMNDLKSRLAAEEQGFVSANSADEMVSDGGVLGSTIFGESILDGDGIHTSADLVDINWWLPLNLSSDDVTSIRALVYDGTKYIYAGGIFARIGGIDAANIARYSLITRNWESIGGQLNGQVYALAIDGDNLYAGGAFTNADGISTADYIAKYSITGGTWASIGGQLNINVYALAIGGDNLYVGGLFENADGIATADYIAKYSITGGTWASIGGQLNERVYALAIDGDNLYVGGAFTNADGIATADRIAKYSITGGTWASIGGQLNGDVYALVINGDSLYAGGAFTNADGIATADRIAKYSITDGTWASIGPLSNTVRCLAVDGDNLYVGGLFENAYGITGTERVAVWNGNVWNSMSNAGGTTGLSEYINTLLVLPSGSVVAGGVINHIGSLECKGITLYCKPLSEAIDILSSLFELYAARGQMAEDITSGTIDPARLPTEGWQEITETWTRTGNHSFTVAGDLTSKYKKGKFLRYKDGGAYEYGTVLSSSYSSPNTTVNLIPTTDYAMAATTITDTAIGTSVLPDGWPVWFNRTPSISCSGSMTISSSTLLYARFKPVGLTMSERIAYNPITLGGTASTDIRITAAVPSALDLVVFACNVANNGGAQEIGTGLILQNAGSPYFRCRRNLAANYTVAAGAQSYVSADYEW